MEEIMDTNSIDQLMARRKEIAYTMVTTETQLNSVLETSEKNCDYQHIKIKNNSDSISNCMTGKHVENVSTTSFSAKVGDRIVTLPKLISKQVLDKNKQCNNEKAIMVTGRSTSYTLHYKCDLCQTVFTTPANLAYHYQQHTKEKNMNRRKIEDCNRRSKFLYARMQVGVGAATVYQCDRCTLNFKFPTQLALHYGNHFAQTADVNLHESEERKPGASDCVINRGPYEHLKVGNGENVVYECDKCEKQFKVARSFAKHYNTHVDLRKVKRFLCDQCDKAFSSRGKLIVHYRNHTGDHPFICEHCGKTFAAKANLSCHIILHSGERPYNCKQCDKSFSTHSNLAHHAKVHRDEKLFQCQHCGKTFGYKSALTVHLRRHTGDRPFKCDMCSWAFVDSGQLIVHRRTHTGERPYVCTYCGKGFIDSKHKTIHTRIHTGHKPYKCHICPDKAFVQNMQLKLHMRTHHGTK